MTSRADIRPKNNLRTFRLTASITQEDLSDLTGIPAPYISQIERGIMNPSGKQIIELCKIFRISADVLFPRGGK
jgi:transcriptional regulator with XRE-family HTH domain